MKGGGNTVEVDSNLLGNISLKITGENNYIRLTDIKISANTQISIHVFGDNNSVNIDKAHFSSGVDIILGQNHPNFGKVENTVFQMLPNCSVEYFKYGTANSNAECYIGEDCMFSDEIILLNTDVHPILSIKSGKVLNWVDQISIGNHCWIGHGVTILKNTIIPDDCIIGYNAVVSGRLKESHAAYAGNPARIIKKEVTWDANGARVGFIQNRGMDTKES